MNEVHARFRTMFSFSVSAWNKWHPRNDNKQNTEYNTRNVYTMSITIYSC